jgi:microcystin-dependent protein
MGTPYLGEIRLISWNFPPKGWAFCNGQTLAINQNQAIFALLGTMYGGNGQTTFQLPNLQGATPIHMGNGFIQGQRGGEVSHTVTLSELPQHTHPAVSSSNAASLGDPTGNFWANGSQSAYAATPAQSMNPATVSAIGGSQPHNNMPPYLVMNFIIALQGIFPSQN